jgi:hypothetical protein
LQVRLLRMLDESCDRTGLGGVRACRDQASSGR